jgi:hypothetical protein
MNYYDSYDSGSWWNDDWDGKSQSTSPARNYYGSRWSGYREKLSSWKSDKEGNVVFPEIGWGDNNIIRDKKRSYTEENRNIKASDILPGFIGGDLYRLLYHENPQLTKPSDNSKEVWFDSLSSLPIYGLAMQTNKSKFWSKIATEAIIDAILQEMADKNQLNQQKNTDGTVELERERTQRISQAIKDALNKSGVNKEIDKSLKDALEKGLNEAQDQVNKTKSFMSELGINPEQVEQNSAGDMEVLERLLAERNGLIDKFYFNADAAVEFLKSTSNFFNTALGKQKIFQTDFLHADNFSDIINPELFEFPFEIPNINVMSSKRSVQIDLYIDVSGSMSNMLSTKGDGTELRIIDAVSIFAYKLWRKGIVHSVNVFDGAVRSIEPKQILFISPNGGTSFQAVLTHYIKQKQMGSKRLAFILTDGCDDTSLYHKDAYWMFIEGGPYNQMATNFPDTQMRIWNDGQIKKISEWKCT